LKIIKKKPKFINQAKIEIKILKDVLYLDKLDESNVIKIFDNFNFRGFTVLKYFYNKLVHRIRALGYKSV